MAPILSSASSTRPPTTADALRAAAIATVAAASTEAAVVAVVAVVAVTAVSAAREGISSSGLKPRKWRDLPRISIRIWDWKCGWGPKKRDLS